MTCVFCCVYLTTAIVTIPISSPTQLHPEHHHQINAYQPIYVHSTLLHFHHSTPLYSTLLYFHLSIAPRYSTWLYLHHSSLLYLHHSTLFYLNRFKGMLLSLTFVPTHYDSAPGERCCPHSKYVRMLCIDVTRLVWFDMKCFTCSDLIWFDLIWLQWCTLRQWLYWKTWLCNCIFIYLRAVTLFYYVMAVYAVLCVSCGIESGVHHCRGVSDVSSISITSYIRSFTCTLVCVRECEPVCVSVSASECIASDSIVTTRDKAW